MGIEQPRLGSIPALQLILKQSTKDWSKKHLDSIRAVCPQYKDVLYDQLVSFGKKKKKKKKRSV